MPRSRKRSLLACLLGLALVAAACGGDDSTETGSDTETPGTVDANLKDEVDKQLGGESTTTSAGTAESASTTAVTTKKAASIDDWLKIWEGERAAIVKKIKDNKWGTSADGKTVTGPEGFTMDLSACPGGWSNTEGLTDTEIKIGHTTAQSGTLADYGNIARSMGVLFEYVNTTGIEDSTGKTRKINLIVKDDGYDAARTIPLVDELLNSEKVFAMWTLGSPNTMKTYDTIGKACVPQPLSMTGHPAWGDPVKHPWTTGYQMAYNTEAVLWGAFIDQRFKDLSAGDGKVTVAALVMNNDFGKAYDAGFKAFVAQSPNKANIEYVVETIEPSAPTVTDPMTTLQSKNPDVFIAMTAGASCTQAIVAAAENGMKGSAKFVFMPSVCKSQSFVGRDKVGGDGSAANDWWVVGGGGKDFNSAAYDTDPYIKWARDQMAAKGIDYKSSGSLGSGYSFGWAMWQALEVASQLEGGLTRSNLIVALRTMEMSNPMVLDGIKFNMNGNKDAYFIEGSEFAKYNSATQIWDQQGAIIELSGKSSNCSWDQSIGNCA